MAAPTVPWSEMHHRAASATSATARASAERSTYSRRAASDKRHGTDAYVLWPRFILSVEWASARIYRYAVYYISANQHQCQISLFARRNFRFSATSKYRSRKP